ncbi:MAG TPA: FG-GAP-like repeat-containing protein [Gemmatimonadaceae bacterium]|nr:FG-GAP-like repeat-containing protein [Gemmatimonadaceae bacterium]
MADIALTGRAVVVLTLLAIACGPGVDTSWHEEDGYRWRGLDVPRRGSPGFTLIDPSSSGVAFVNSVSELLLVQNRNLAHGGGVCLGDVDGDGLVDVHLARTEGPNALYRNVGGWRFEDITERAGVAAGDRYSTGCAFADVDGDGDLDLLVVALGGPNALFLNDGAGNFIEQEDAGLGSSAGSMSIALADVNGDGWLDLYIVNYKAYTAMDRMPPQERSFDEAVRQLGPRRFELRDRYRQDYKLVERADLGGISLVQRADPDFFYRNDGHGRFVREPIAGNSRFVDEQGAVLAEESEYFGLAAMFVDLDGDGAPDLYVANDFEDPDQFWRNDGRGNFRLVPWYAVRSTSNSTMAVDVLDVDRDGRPDLFQVDMLSRDTRRLKTQIPTHTAVRRLPGEGDDRPQMQRNTLHLNRGDGTFAEIARFAGVGASGWSWSAVAVDVDLDGWEDILIGTGHVWDVMDGDTQSSLRTRLREIDWRRMLLEFPPLPLGNVALRNLGDLTFDDASSAWRFDLGEDISHGMALADLDGDGDLDVVINRLGKPAAVLRNDATAPRIAIRLRGAPPNTAGIGSRVRVLGGAVPMQQREVVAGGLYLSGSDPMLTFATGDAREVDIEVDWRDGTRTAITGAGANRLYEIDQSSARPIQDTAEDAGRTMFEDISDQLGGHRHVEPYFDDFARQLLLPNSFSQLGPGVAWDDVDGDGREDLIVGAGRTGTLAWFRNEGSRLTPVAPRVAPAHVDLTTILGFPDGRGGRVTIAGVSSYEMGTMNHALGVPSAVAYSLTEGTMTPLVQGDSASVGPLALADYTGNGSLDLFVGGRIVPGRYPHAASSRLFRNDGGRLVLDAANSALLAGLGMVSGALFADIDGNGWPDLIVAIEWGPIRIFLNENGRFRAAPEIPGLSGVTSRWNGLATGDLDGDGRLDIIATSWGRNTEHQASPARPLYLYTFATERGPEVLLAQEDPRVGGIAPLTTFNRFGLALPGAAQRLRTFSAYADATVAEALGPRGVGATRLTATSMDHTVFLNRGGRFEARPLPAKAQLAPAFYAGVADFDGDGNEDVFLTQNFFATELATARYDAGRSLLLLGDGSGGLNAVPGQRSGLKVYGEQRGAAYADFDGDGRLDLAVSQNGAPTRLFRNTGATPGIRVRLSGPPGNPTAVGAQIRLRYGDRSGPVREVQSGSGYWSQNGAVQVLGRDGEPTALWIRWPGGREQVIALEPGQAEVVIGMR